MIRSKDEIVEKIRDISVNGDIFGFERSVLFDYLTFDEAKEFISSGKRAAAEEEWGNVKSLSESEILNEAKDYMEFAWGKVANHRGLSASRSVDKMRAYCWLLGVQDQVDWDNYAQYGAPVLYSVCRVLGFPHPDSPEIMNMVNGRRCIPDCEMGCGR